MKEIWTKSTAEYHGEFVNFPPMMTWRKPVQKPHPPIIVGGAFPHAARRYGDEWALVGHPTATSTSTCRSLRLAARHRPAKCSPFMERMMGSMRSLQRRHAIEPRLRPLELGGKRQQGRLLPVA